MKAMGGMQGGAMPNMPAAGPNGMPDLNEMMKSGNMPDLSSMMGAGGMPDLSSLMGGSRKPKQQKSGGFFNNLFRRK